MAIKAGRVGVAPSEVDELGRVKGGNVPENVLTEDDVLNSLFSSEVKKPLAANQGNVLRKLLTANNKQFQFAYDSATDKYGYKAGGADTFHPFKEEVYDFSAYDATFAKGGKLTKGGTTLLADNKTGVVIYEIEYDEPVTFNRYDVVVSNVKAGTAGGSVGIKGLFYNGDWAVCTMSYSSNSATFNRATAIDNVTKAIVTILN